MGILTASSMLLISLNNPFLPWGCCFDTTSICKKILLCSFPKSLLFIVVIVQANYMNNINLRELLKLGKSIKSANPVSDTPCPTQPFDRMSNGSDRSTSDYKNDRWNVTFWSCASRRHVQSKICLWIRQDLDCSFEGYRHGLRGRAGFFSRQNNNTN